VSSQAIVEVGCAVGKKSWETLTAHVTIGITFEVEQLNKISTIIITNSCNVNLTAFSTQKT
jgi:hypothetical protein